ncbi:MAG: hypothetical protein MK111_13825 [Crocosphaera sp.]|uniref:Uncharacterized protein n=3 Tax=Crocosphaera watsonii TaxID=263511 RepID=T2JMZ3_CROWT|nr:MULTISPECIES: hypothetical protein [Crocosphaera]EHJ09880.1 hypothetical protein CWATWH0003_5343 [Crocosphaera watsonii WH 0003]MCH2245699.1 hypothetical protein [Crocosphaera sp.]CCQ54242.1 hypothetical protein CWATWH0005_3422 [Crocosphaera watsonii WH 0005]CCQ66384.1 hypothetical protein CWATWH0402_4041 [Crocosphaera watsonii WH 0402]
MAGPGAKGGMWSKNGKGKRVLITKSMAKQMAAAGVSAQTDADYAKQAAKLRDKNNAEDMAKRKADVEKRTIRGDNQPSTDKSKWSKTPPDYFLVDKDNIKGVKYSDKPNKEASLIDQTGTPRDIPVVIKSAEAKQAGIAFQNFQALNPKSPTFQAKADDLPVFVANKADIPKIKRQQEILKEIDKLGVPDVVGSKALFGRKNRLKTMLHNRSGIDKKAQFFLNDVDEFTNKPRKFSAKENKVIEKLANSILETGTLLRPIPTVQTGLAGRGQALGNPLLLEAARRAYKKDPQRAGAVSTYYLADRQQYEAYKKQGKRKG